MKISKELIKGSTSMLVLSLLEKENMYGYQMIKELSRKSKNLFELKEGTLYPILHNLEQKNYISSYWDNTGTKKRKYYSITKEGKKHLKERKGEWISFSSGINEVMGGVLFGY
ncbi:MAG: PadR family transcriptional regulator [Clostridiales bacterium]|nr:PadR family transcriptional regulator [Clostridiales bacterium]